MSLGVMSEWESKMFCKSFAKVGLPNIGCYQLHFPITCQFWRMSLLFSNLFGTFNKVHCISSPWLNVCHAWRLVGQRIFSVLGEVFGTASYSQNGPFKHIKKFQLDKYKSSFLETFSMPFTVIISCLSCWTLL